MTRYYYYYYLLCIVLERANPQIQISTETRTRNLRPRAYERPCSKVTRRGRTGIREGGGRSHRGIKEERSMSRVRARATRALRRRKASLTARDDKSRGHRRMAATAMTNYESGGIA